jgi:hypothetical protein
MIPFRIVFAITAILLSRDAFAEPGMWSSIFEADPIS